jgi:peptidoglycan/xylan/chitin deacetylase (PgdA/CDA1 family)
MCYAALRAVGATAMGRRLQRGAVVLCYHNVVAHERPRAGDPGLHLTRERFERQVRWLARHYDIVSLREVADRVAAGRNLRGVAAMTFDDGYAGVFEHAVPILRALNAPATVFVVADAPATSAEFWWDRPEIVARLGSRTRDRWLTDLRGDGAAILGDGSVGRAATLPPSHRAADWTTIRASLGNGIAVGAHSATHRSLPTLTDAELHREIVGSRSVIEDAAGVAPDLFAYPYGLSSARVRALVRAAGYRAGVTVDAGVNGPRADPYALARINVPANISQPAFEAWTAGLCRTC